METLEGRTAKLFGLDHAGWERHTNPWSVWTRNSALPALVLAAWSRRWLGRWAIVPGILAVLWTWLNPRLFPKPHSTDNWASKAVLGERVWANRREVPVPEHHRRVPHVLSAVAGAGSMLVAWGVAALRVWPTLLGMALVYAGKLWFLDRMVWLYEDMKDESAEYAAWLY